MFSRPVQALLLAASISLGAEAQIRSSGLDDVNAWNTTLLARGERALPDRFWISSDPDFLLELMQSLDVETMSVPERNLLSRALRSPSVAPRGEGSGELQTMRLELLAALNERQAVSELGRQVDTLPDGVDPDAITSDNRLARGELGLVCDQMNPEAAEKFWLELRIICAIEGDNLAEAELALELAAIEEGADPWVTETAIAIIAESEERPDARLGSGLQVAFSELANLEVTPDALATARPDLAVAYANDRDNPLELRVLAARRAVTEGLLDAPQYRSLFVDYVSAPDFEPQTATEEAFFLLTQVDEAPVILRPGDLTALDPIIIEQEPEAGEDETEAVVSLERRQVEALAAALEEARASDEGIATTAGLFEDDLKRFPADAVEQEEALSFARAAMAVGNMSLASFWLDAADVGVGDASYEVDLMRGYGLIMSRERNRATIERVAGNLVGEDASTAVRAQALSLFAVWASFDVSLPVEARQALAAQGDDEETQPSSGQIVAIEAAARNGAHGEALLLALNAVGGNPAELSPAGLQSVLSTLRRLGAEDEARELALATGGF
ncbi:MAG: hypothetical protein MK186_02020 [Henriciella sp.]|nr:hypothetical protein [Henriciella sp.]